MVYGYIRVSTDMQTVENQRFELTRWAKRNNIKIDSWIDESISGAKDYKKRKLGVLLKKVKEGDTILATEISRLGRNLLMIMEILNFCMEKKCKVKTIKDNYELGGDIQSKVLAFAFGLAAEIERNMIQQRTKQALDRKKAEGVILGRPLGKKNSKLKLSGQEEKIKKFISKNISITEMAKKMKVDRGTVSYFIKVNPELYSFYDNNRGKTKAEENNKRILELYIEKLTVDKIASQIHISYYSVHDVIKENIYNPVIRKEYLRRIFWRSGNTIKEKIKKGIDFEKIAKYYTKQYDITEKEIKDYLENNDIYN